MGFWEGWWWNELTRPNDKYKHMPEVELDYEVLGKAQAYIEKHEPEWFEEGIRTGEQMRFQEGVEAGIGRKTAVKEQLLESGFEGAKELIKAIDDGRVEVYSEDGYNKFRWAK